MQLPVYLDYAATTPVDPRVIEAMTVTLRENFGNPASRSHVYGWKAEEAVEQARRHVADLIQADPREIIWTSGATESDNLAIKGVAHHYQAGKKHLVTSVIEHKAVLDSVAELGREGFAITYLAPDGSGLIAPEQVEKAIRPDTVLVSLMHVNNEIGAVNDIASVGKICRGRNVLFHVDAAQGAGKIDIDVQALNVDLLSISAHKMYGPKGVGALYVRRSPDVRLDAQIHGGGHERGMRSGTLATHQIVGFGEAARFAKMEMAEESARILELRNRFLKGVQQLEQIQVNGSLQQRVAGNLNISLAGVEGETLLMSLRDLALSTGSACTSASLEPSYVLKAIGVDDELAHSSLRFSFGRFTTEEEVDFAANTLCAVVEKLRAGSPLWAKHKSIQA